MVVDYSSRLTCKLPMFKLPYVLPNDLRFRKIQLGKFKKTPEMLKTERKYLDGHPKHKL